ncbi:MAG: hypothetical protein HGA85_02025 [Nanoarchaeota archaeon]|nr:hypothetical protein [Nanoarchaeota archaeon]
MAKFHFLFFLLILPIVFSQVEETTHSFVVNTYYPSAAPAAQVGPSIRIEPILVSAAIGQCTAANYSFKLTNQGTATQIFSFSVTGFTGKSYLASSVELAGKKSAIIKFKLEPECRSYGESNPFLVVETEKELAKIPLSLKVAQGRVIEESECLYYFNSTVCSSDKYIRFYRDSSAEIDLQRHFYDPDSDKLAYRSESDRIKVDIKGTKAILTSRHAWHGAETVTIIAEDGNGGKTESKIYVQALDKDIGIIKSLFSVFF